MLEKNIKKVLRNKIDDWIKTIKNDRIKKLIKRSLVISGGCIPSLVLNETVNDYDCYFTSAADLYEIIRYYVKEGILIGGGVGDHYFSDGLNQLGVDELKRHFKEGSNLEGANRVSLIIPSSGIIKNEEVEDNILNDQEDQDTKKYVFKMATSNALTLTNKIQIIMRFVGPIEEVHKNFDFEHAKCWWSYESNKLHISAKAYELIINKKIVYKHSKYPICSLVRLRKFIKRGWTVSAGEILKMAVEVHNLKLETIADLQDQLMGVDSAYFSMLISALHNSSKEFDLKNTGYLFKMIDSIF